MELLVEAMQASAVGWVQTWNHLENLYIFFITVLK
jgi:hypothetical protein